MIEVTQEGIDANIAEKPNELKNDELTKQQRHAICMSCEHKTTKLGFDACGRCGCFIAFKTAFKRADCPEKKWVVDNIH